MLRRSTGVVIAFYYHLLSSAIICDGAALQQLTRGVGPSYSGLFLLQDAIDLALSLVRITVEMERFSFGTNDDKGEIPGVGGAVDVLVVTPSGVQWIKQKALTAN